MMILFQCCGMIRFGISHDHLSIFILVLRHFSLYNRALGYSYLALWVHLAKSLHTGILDAIYFGGKFSLFLAL